MRVERMDRQELGEREEHQGQGLEEEEEETRGKDEKHDWIMQHNDNIHSASEREAAAFFSSA